MDRKLKGRELLLATLHLGDPDKVQPGERPTTKIAITSKGCEVGLIDHVVISALIFQRGLWATNQTYVKEDSKKSEIPRALDILKSACDLVYAIINGVLQNQ